MSRTEHDPVATARAALDAQRQSGGPAHPDLIPPLLDTAAALDRFGDDPDEVARLLLEALRLAEQHGTDAHRQALILFRLAGLTGTDLVRREDATAYALRAADLVEAHPSADGGVDPAQLVDLLRHLAGRHDRSFYTTDAPKPPGPSTTEQLLRRAIGLGDATLDPHHEQIGFTLDALAGLLQRENRADETEPLLRRQVDLYAHAFGPTHDFVADNLDALADLLIAQDRLAEAEDAAVRAVDVREASGTWVERHRSLEPGYARLGELRTRRLGAKHPEVVATTIRQADALFRYAELERRGHRDHNAIPAYQKALALQEQHLDPHDPARAASLFGLAEAFVYDDRFDPAIPLYKRAFTIWEHALEAAAPTDRPGLLQRLDATAAALKEACGYADRARPEEALPFLDRLARHREGTSSDPDLDPALARLAAFHAREAGGDYLSQSDHADAEAAYRQVLDLQGARHGPDAPELAEPLDAFLRFLLARSRHDDARPVLDRLVGIERAQRGADAAAWGDWLDAMGDLLHQHGRASEAIGLYTEALDRYRAAYGDDDAVTDGVRQKLYELMV